MILKSGWLVIRLFRVISKLGLTKYNLFYVNMCLSMEYFSPFASKFLSFIGCSNVQQ